MAKYSSDSDSERSTSKYRKKYTRRSSSLDSSDSSSHQKRLKYSNTRRRYRSRSRNKEKSERRYKYSTSSSRDRRRHRSQKSRSSSGDRNRFRKTSDSKEKSASRSSTFQSNVKVLSSDKVSSTSKDINLVNEIKIKGSIIDDINNDEFIPKQFVSTKTKETKMKNIVIDMNADTIHVPQITNTSNNSNSIFHSSIMVDKETKFDKWVKKLYSLRQKAVNELHCT